MAESVAFPLQIAIRIAKEGLRPVLPEDHGGVRNLLHRCWDAEQSLRPDFDAIIEKLEDALQRLTSH